jgi:hypothetical protein
LSSPEILRLFKKPDPTTRERIRQITLRLEELAGEPTTEENMKTLVSKCLEAIQIIKEQLVTPVQNPQIEEAMLVFRQTEDKIQQALDSIVDIAFFVRRLETNRELEKEVLLKIKKELGR